MVGNTWKLRTKDQLWHMKLIPNQWCLLCGTKAETISHILFECHFSSACLGRIQEWTWMKIDKKELKEMLEWINKRKKWTEFRKNGMRAIIATCIYHIWRNRNEVLWTQTTWTIAHTVQSIKQDIKNRFNVVLPKKN